MKRTIILLMVLVLGFSLLAGCGGKGGGGGDPSKVTGETYDAGNVSALVPKGWKAYPSIDPFKVGSGEDDKDPNGVSIHKGAKSDFDIMSTPGVKITYFPDTVDIGIDMAKGFYDDVKDLDKPLTVGDKTWKGFYAKTGDYPILVLYIDDQPQKYQLLLWLENSGKKISIEDAEVLAIIGSIKGK